MTFARRTFLRGLGASIALPSLVSLRPVTAANAARPLAITKTGAPLRTAFVYFPNGAIPAAWWPEGDEQSFQFGQTLAPLQSFRDDIQILKGLEHKSAEGGPDGGGDHARGNGTFLTGVRLKKSATDLHAGTSIDQVLAKRVGDQTRFASLELTCDAIRQSGECDSGYACAYQFNLAWSSPTTPVAPEASPRLVFERLFGEGNPGERWSNMQMRRQQQRSILDFVMEDARDMNRRLSVNDQLKLDQYLSGLRDLELRLDRAEKFGEVQDPGVATPTMTPLSYADHVDLMFEMLALAFQTDSTRISTLMLAHDGSNRSFSDIGVVEGHHDLSHHQNKEDRVAKVAEIDLWYTRRLANFLKRMKETEDVDGNSLLDNSMIVYGSGNADGNRHTHSDLPVVLAGGGGGTLRPGRYVKNTMGPMTNLYLGLAQRLGVEDLTSFGDSNDVLNSI